MHKKFQEFRLLLGVISFARPMEAQGSRQEPQRPCFLQRVLGIRRSDVQAQQSREISLAGQEQSSESSLVALSLLSVVIINRRQTWIYVSGRPATIGAVLRHFLQRITPENIDGYIDPRIFQVVQDAFNRAPSVAGMFNFRNILPRAEHVVLCQFDPGDSPNGLLIVKMNNIHELFVPDHHNAGQLAALFDSEGNNTYAPSWSEDMMAGFNRGFADRRRIMTGCDRLRPVSFHFGDYFDYGNYLSCSN